MTDLEDTFGKDFAEQVQKKTAERRQERNRITEEQLATICALAVNEGKFKDGEPMFTYTTDNGIDHEVMLVQVPNPDRGEVWEHLSEPWEGAAKLPLDYLGQWYWSVFPNKEDVKKLNQGDWAIVVGSVEESENDKGDTFYNIYPVRGIATLEEAKEYADQALDADGFGGGSEEQVKQEEEEQVSEDPEPEQKEESESGGDSSDSPFDGDDSSDDGSSDSGSSNGGLKGMLGGGDDTEDDEDEDEDEVGVPYSEIASLVEGLADEQDEDEDPQVYEIDEDSDFHERLTEVVCARLEIDNEEGAHDVVWDVIENHKEDEEEEEDDTTSKLF